MDWTTIIVAVIAGGAASLPGIIVALKTKSIVNGRMSELLEAREGRAEARALLHERANNANSKVLHDAAEAALLVRETAAAAKTGP